MPQFIFTKYSKKKFEKLSPEVSQRILKKLKSCKTHPDFFSLLETLTNFGEASHRLRIGDYRIILKIKDHDNLIILDLGHRKEVYK